MTTQTINFSKISKDKIAEYIELMREHQLNCVKDGNFIEAELAKQRVIQLKKIQDKKDLIEAKRRQKVDKRKFQENKIQEIKETKKELNEKYAEEMTKLEDSLLELKKKQEDELKNYFIDFEKNYPTDIKPSNELIEKQKQLDYYIKTEDYPNAHLAQVEIGQIQKKEKEKFLNEKEKKIEKEISKIQNRHNNETQAMELKINNHKNKILREQNQKLTELELKFKNKERKLDRTQKAEREHYERIISSRGKKNVSRSMPKNF